ncbi:MAG: type II toxin-antitoxin system PemK/MazF family toxin [Patescibacteria group bacterium]
MHVKRFLEWIGLKERLDSKISGAPFVNEGEIWWASLGENIGYEINGKSKDFTRPIIIFKKLTHDFYLVVPLSTKMKNGTWYIPFKQRGVEMVACLSQVRSIDYRRLHSKFGELDPEDFKRIKMGFLSLYS